MPERKSSKCQPRPFLFKWIKLDFIASSDSQLQPKGYQPVIHMISEGFLYETRKYQTHIILSDNQIAPEHRQKAGKCTHIRCTTKEDFTAGNFKQVTKATFSIF